MHEEITSIDVARFVAAGTFGIRYFIWCLSQGALLQLDPSSRAHLQLTGGTLSETSGVFNYGNSRLNALVVDARSNIHTEAAADPIATAGISGDVISRADVREGVIDDTSRVRLVTHAEVMEDGGEP
jgi:hypothetical protein